MSKRKKRIEKKSSEAVVWTQDQYDDYMKEMYGMEFIAGYTSNGVPYGIFIHDGDFTDDDEPIIQKKAVDSDDELPFYFKIVV